MRLNLADDLLARFCRAAPGLLKWLGQWETRGYLRELAAIPLERPVFIAGLARAGSTLLLELLAAIDGVATHRYRDFPFLCTPILWNRLLDRFPAPVVPVERPHRDGIWITRDSPEAMEEPLWMAFFPHLHRLGQPAILTEDDSFPAFEAFYRDHLRKILWLRNGRRYLAKANYHVTRLDYLGRLFPDAEFIVPIRHPLTHVPSLVRQHQLFCDYARHDRRVASRLAWAGHFEFGPQRAPIHLDHRTSDRTRAAWSRGDEHLGYAIQWNAVYRLVRDCIERSAGPTAVGRRLHILRHEDLCRAPEATFRVLAQAIGLAEFPLERTLVRLREVRAPLAAIHLSPEHRAAITAETAETAAYFGYAAE